MLVIVVEEDIVYLEGVRGFVLREGGVVLHYSHQLLASHLL